MKEIIKYLTELKANNNREWFQEHKNEYDVLRARFIAEMETLLSKLKEFDPDLAGLDVKSCLFRIYRDIRFSYDKTPYKPYFSIYFAKGGRKSPRAGYYFHFEPGSISLSGGVWCPDPKVLRALRQAIYDNSDEFRAIVENEQFKKVYPSFFGESLKTVPRPFPKDADCAEYLKLKNLAADGPCPDSLFYTDGWIDTVAEGFRTLKPFNDFLNYTVDDFYE